MRLHSAGSDADDPVPSVDAPEPDTDRGLPNAVGASAVAFVAVPFAMIALGALTGDPVTWGDAGRVVSNAFTAAGVAGGLRWVFGRDD
ncbi:hypothetical protein [Halorubrum sp. DTA98]|uniref:hypothetical protein n=1 Tax=Halorubrum sp. DTA98 TaxID=3402163 RepID=UPI003AAE4DCB